MINQPSHKKKTAWPLTAGLTSWTAFLLSTNNQYGPARNQLPCPTKTATCLIWIFQQARPSLIYPVLSLFIHILPCRQSQYLSLGLLGIYTIVHWQHTFKLQWDPPASQTPAYDCGILRCWDRKQHYAMTTAGPALDCDVSHSDRRVSKLCGLQTGQSQPLTGSVFRGKAASVQTVRQPDLCALVHVVYFQKLAPGQTRGSDWSVRARGWNWHGRRGLEHPWVCQKLEERSADLLTTGSAPARYCAAFENRRKYVWYDRELVNIFNN